MAEAAFVRHIRLFASAVATLLLAAGPAVAECPACDAATPRSIWPIVGAFLLVPPILAAAVILLMRRELRSTLGRKRSTGGAVVSFTPLARFGPRP